MHKLYIGNETYLSLNNAKAMIKELLSKSDSTYISLDLEKTNSTQAMETISSNTLFSTSRVVFLKRVYRNKDREHLIPFLLEYLQKNQTDTFIIWEDQKVSAVTKYVKYFKTNKSLVEYNKLNRNEFLKYAKDKCIEISLNLDTSLISLLSDYSNYDVERLDNNIKKLKLIEKERYSKEDILEITENTLEQDIWKLLDEYNKQGGRPLEILENLFKQGLDPLFIIPMISRNLRLIALTKYLLTQNKRSSEIASLIKVHPFTVRPLIETTYRYDWEKIKTKYQKLSNLDYNIKTGGIEPKLGLTLFCTTL